jgi:hypothetical protein
MDDTLTDAVQVECDDGMNALRGKYGNVLGPFLELMESELHANSSKGDRHGWLSMTPEVGLLEIYWHTAKLSAAVKNNDGALIREHSADVANMAMMLLDVCGGLDVKQSPKLNRPRCTCLTGQLGPDYCEVHAA